MVAHKAVQGKVHFLENAAVITCYLSLTCWVDFLVFLRLTRGLNISPKAAKATAQNLIDKPSDALCL